jgi:hypothetical protein
MEKSIYESDFETVRQPFILHDEFEGIELVCRRAEVAAFYLRGSGVEIGALHKPLTVDKTRASVLYIDYKTLAENRKRYPELEAEEIVNTDIIDDGFILSSIAKTSIDFVIANHALEHSPDPFGTLKIWLSKIRENGVLYVTVPIAEQCYDKGRPITTLEHLLKDHHNFVSGHKRNILATTSDHLWEFILVSGANIRRMNNLEPADLDSRQELHTKLMNELKIAVDGSDSYKELMGAHITKINRVYDIHYHTFSPSSYENFLAEFCDLNNARLENVLKNGNGECIGIVRKKQ